MQCFFRRRFQKELTLQGTSAKITACSCVMRISFHMFSRFVDYKNQAGNALFLILIAVALFAALSYAVTQSGKGGASTSNEQADLLAARMMQDAALVQSTVTRLLVSGCTLAKLNFDNTVFAGYANASAPADKSCNVFDPAGGGLQWLVPPVRALLTVTRPYFYALTPIANLGTISDEAVNGKCILSAQWASCTELVMVVIDISKAVCMKINTRMGIAPGTLDVPQDHGIDSQGTPYNGTFVKTYDDIGTPDVTPDEDLRLLAAPTGCYKEVGGTNNGRYIFYNVLVVQ
jgi:hypothetical protein